jgi:hypothetical protein
MKHKLLTFAGALALLATLGHFYAKPLLAQVRAALVSNVDDPGRIPYQAAYEIQLANRDCHNGCPTNFPSVPAGKRLVITNFSGSIATNVPGGSLVQPFLSVNSVFPPPTIFPATTFQGGLQGLNHFVFNQPTQVSYNAGDQPTGFIGLAAVSTAGAAYFTLTGYMLDCSTGPCAAIAP